MAKGHHSIPDDLDVLIEAALSSEPMQPAPANLHRRVEERLRYTHLREKECQRFKLSMTTLVVGAMSAFSLAGMLIAYTHFTFIMNNGVAGGRGQYDSMINMMFQTFSEYSGAYTLSISMLLAAGTLLIGLIPLRKYMNSH